MILETLSRRRRPIGLGILLGSLWLAFGIRQADPGLGIAVLDSPLGILAPRTLSPGWHLAPPGLLRISTYPVQSATFSFGLGERDEPSLLSREGIAVVARGTIRYRVEADRVLDVHRLLGPRFERDAVDRWVREDLRAAIRSASYSEISGARTTELRESLGRTLADRFRGAGLVLLSCDVAGVQIRASHDARPVAARRTAGMKVLLIGLDGADWNILDPLIRDGRLPNIGRLARAGVRARLRTITPMLSPVIWTSIATGVLPGRHGIIDFLATTGRDGERVPVTSTLRKTKAIWNILSENGLTVGVVGWWASYPAEHVNGFVVSDRVAYQLFGAHPAREQAQEGKVFPRDLEAQVASLTVAPERLGLSEIGRYVRLSSDPSSLSAEQNKMIDDLRTLIAAGDTYANLSLALGRRFGPDFQAVYIESTDTVAHLFMRHAPPALSGVDREEARLFGKAVDEYYRHVDEQVGRLLEAAGENAAVILCSDHGFRTGENRPLTESRIGYGQAADWHRKYGVLVLHGPPFLKGRELEDASILDITPTILALFGLPVAEDMDGRPIIDALDPAFLQTHPVTYIPTHETIEGAIPALIAEAAPPADAPPPTDPEGDRELKQKLQSLGYLRQDTANSHNNRGMLLMTEGKYKEAIAEFDRAIQASEDLGIARLNIARAHYKMKDYAAAITALESHLARQPRSKEAESLLGNIDMENGRPREAEEHFKKALAYEPNFTDARNSLGILYDRLGREQDAIREFLRVIEVDKEYAEALNNLGVIYKKQGRRDEAVAAFRKAISADADFAGSYSNLALVYEQEGKRTEAEEQYRKALKRDPKNAAVRTNYGGLLYALGRLEEARRQLETAVGIDPAYASAHNNLGAVYGKLGRFQDEIASYREAVRLDPDYADVHHNLGLALLKRGTIEQGESEMRRVLEIDRRYAAAYTNLGRSLLTRDRGQEALELLEAGAAAVQDDAQLQVMLGEARLANGQKDRAIEAFDRSLELNPDQPGLRLRVDELRGAP
jgi:tetratricopeptide (TPR) repeat protein